MCWWSVGVLMRFVWRLLGVGMAVFGWGGCVCLGCEWVSEFWTSGIAYTVLSLINAPPLINAP